MFNDLWPLIKPDTPDNLAHPTCFGTATITPLAINPELLVDIPTGGLVLDNILVDCLVTHFDTVGLKFAADLLRAVLTHQPLLNNFFDFSLDYSFPAIFSLLPLSCFLMGLLISITSFPLVALEFLVHGTLAEAYGLSYLGLGFSCFLHSVDYSTIFLAEVAVLFLHCLLGEKQRLQHFHCLRS